MIRPECAAVSKSSSSTTGYKVRSSSPKRRVRAQQFTLRRPGSMLKVTFLPTLLAAVCSATVIPKCEDFTETVSQSQALQGKALTSSHQFDTLERSGLGTVLPILDRIGTATYNNLDYGTASLVIFENAPVPAITPKSPNNTATIGIGGTLLGGLSALSLNLTPQSTIKPAGTTKSFDLDSLYIGCALNTMVSVAGVRTPCGVTVTGKDINGDDLPSQSLEWGPDELLGSSMQYWELSGIVEAKEVTIKITSSIAQPLTVVFMDNVKYCVRT
ncbi:hypothetical protein HII31_03859 [Pseudocercospora fuligena]|uniref:Uncharacterized protein n=1 Tax=Pseudocercospora fuligena TaxID=685502 RepID=A0A8H6RPC7_9PEZI|nr:hypothetical protein HII31_03859 [Pseudocercospora fuligena]